MTSPKTALEMLAYLEETLPQAIIANPQYQAVFATLRRHLEPQPIESADKDFRTILLFCKLTGWATGYWDGESWIEPDGTVIHPTHCLPLPAHATANQD